LVHRFPLFASFLYFISKTLFGITTWQAL
jgi:hypothetical protein